MTVTPNKAMPIGCCRAGRRVATIVMAVGISAPPISPWPARPMIMVVRSVAIPHSIEKAVNITTAISSSVRKPSNRSSQALSGMMMISATRNDVAIQVPSEPDAPISP